MKNYINHLNLNIFMAIMRYQVGTRFFNSLEAAKLFAKQTGNKVKETDAFVEKKINKLEKKENSFFTKVGRSFNVVNKALPTKSKKSNLNKNVSSKLKKAFATPNRISTQRSDSDRFNDFFR